MRLSLFGLLGFLLILTQISVAVHASTFIGNGGDAVECRDEHGHILTTQLLDYFEAPQLYGIQVQLPNASVDENVEALLSRIAEISPLRAQRYKTWIDDFKRNALYLSASDLTPIQDTDAMELPKGCVLEQLAIQRTPDLPGDHRYLISRDVWNRLDSSSRAGLILHEVIYRELLSYGHTGSIYVRRFNSFIGANQQSSLISAKSIYDLFMSLHFAITDLNHYDIALLQCQDKEGLNRAYCNNGTAAAAAESSFEGEALSNGWIVSQGALPIVDQNLGLVLENEGLSRNFASFYPSGRLKSIPAATYKWQQQPGVEAEISDVLFFDSAASPVRCLSFASADSVQLRSAQGGFVSAEYGWGYEFDTAFEVINSWNFGAYSSRCFQPF